jgi:hypothetical protein
MPAARPAIDAAIQGASAGILGQTLAPLLGGPEAILWAMAAMGICSLADVMAPPASTRWRLATRYAASVAVTLAASYTAAAWVVLTWPQWGPHQMAVRIGAALAAGLLLHPVIALAPRLLEQGWGAVLDRVRGRAAGSGP